MKRVLLGLLCLSALTVTGAQGAGLAPLPDSGREVESITVRFDDLNLGSAAGARTLYGRLKAAARRVCGAVDLRNLGAVEDVRRCREEALDGAVARIDNPRLTALHERRDETPELVGLNLRFVAQR